MRVCAIAGILLSLIFVASNESVRASDANEIQKMMANVLRQQATALANQGLLEQAETFLRSAKQIEMKLAGRGLVEGHLSLAGVTDEPRVMKRLQDLQHAEAHDLARQAKEIYDRVKSEWVEELRQKRDAISQRPYTGDQGQMQVMRAEIKKAHSEIEQLRAEVKALRQQVQER